MLQQQQRDLSKKKDNTTVDITCLPRGYQLGYYKDFLKHVYRIEEKIIEFENPRKTLEKSTKILAENARNNVASVRRLASIYSWALSAGALV